MHTFKIQREMWPRTVSHCNKNSSDLQNGTISTIPEVNITGPKDTLKTVPKSQITIDEKPSPKRPQSLFDPVVKHTSSIFYFFSLFTLNHLSTTVVQDILNPQTECPSFACAQSSVGLALTTYQQLLRILCVL